MDTWYDDNINDVGTPADIVKAHEISHGINSLETKGITYLDAGKEEYYKNYLEKKIMIGFLLILFQD